MTENRTKKKKKLSQNDKSLAGFDSLPDSANVREPVVTALFACSRSTLWRRVNQGTLPQPKKINRTTCWNVGDIRKAIAELTPAANTKAPEKKDPRTPVSLSDPRVQNMGLRDYFAAHALAGLLSCPDTVMAAKGFEETSGTTVSRLVSELAYMFADRMLEARKQ